MNTSHSTPPSARRACLAQPISTQLWRVGLVVLLGIPLATPLLASPLVPDQVITLWPDETVRHLPFAELSLNETSDFSPQILVHSAPDHGVLVVHADHFAIHPGTDFWSVGTDSFVYGYQGSQGIEYATVALVAAVHGDRRSYEDFEDPESILALDPAFQAQWGPAGALTGASGVLLDLDSAVGPQALFVSAPPRGGNSTNSGGDCVRVSLPPTQGPGGFPEGTSVPFTLFSVGDSGVGTPAAEVRISAGPMLEVTAEIWDAEGASVEATVSIPQGEHLFHLDWWKAASPGGSGGLLLLIDHRVAIDLSESTVGTIANHTVDLHEHRVFILDQEPSVPLVLALDDLEVLSDEGTLPLIGRSTAVLGTYDDFEDGDLEGWSNATTTQLATATGSGLRGARGLAVDTEVAYPRFVVDNTPQAQRHYATRLRIDPSDLSMVVGEKMLLFAAARGDDAATEDIHLEIWLRRIAGAFQLRASHRELTGGRVQTPWIPLTEGEHAVALQWWAAWQPEGANGRLRLWLDGTLAASLDNLANGDMVVESVRVGAKNVDPATTGVLALDDFQSWGAP